MSKVSLFKKKLWIIPVVLVAALAVCYIAGVIYYSSHFLKGTNIYGTDVSKMKVEDFGKGLSDYKLSIKEKDENGDAFSEEFTADDAGIKVSSTDSLEKILKSQNVWQWPFAKGAVYVDDATLISYDADKVKAIVSSLKNMQDEHVIKAQDAKISDYDKDNGYTIIKEIEGNELDEEATTAAIEKAITNLKDTVDFEAESCYKKPEITSDNEKLNKLMNKMNKYVNVTVTYKFDDNEEVLDGTTIHKWISVKNDKVKFDDSKVKEYVDTLRKKYDTIFGVRKFKTSYGKKVTVVGGDYGWWMDTATETKELKKFIKKGESGEREPVYFQKAESYGKNDYGDTYVEVNLTAQHVIFYKHGKKIIETDCVTGNSSRGFDTPEGVYSITYKEKNATLNGENYSTPVSYWMPFNRNIGLHDAGWRSSFGGSIYQYSGSHGCVNLPPAAAKTIFEHIDKGTAVICYKLPGSKGGNIADANKKAKKSKKKS